MPQKKNKCKVNTRPENYNIHVCIHTVAVQCPVNMYKKEIQTFYARKLILELDGNHIFYLELKISFL